MSRLLVSALLMLTLASSSGCCLLREFWYALPGCGSCGPCGGCGYGGQKWGCGPCCGGCGERYWGEVSDPPCICGDCCDQCGYWKGAPSYAGYWPGYGQGYMQGVPTPAGPTPAGPVTTPPPPPSPDTASPSPNDATYRGPSDAEMRLPPGAKIVSRSDRLLAPSEAPHGQPQMAGRAAPARSATAMRPSQRRPYAKRVAHQYR